jgi:hypothetical protein
MRNVTIFTYLQYYYCVQIKEVEMGAAIAYMGEKRTCIPGFGGNN